LLIRLCCSKKSSLFQQYNQLQTFANQRRILELGNARTHQMNDGNMIVVDPTLDLVPIFHR